MDWTLNALDAHAAILPKFEDRHLWLWDSYRMIIEKLSDLPAFDTLSLPLIEASFTFNDDCSVPSSTFCG